MKAILSTLLFAFITASCATTSTSLEGPSFNEQVLTAIQTMPSGGGYDGSDATKNKLVTACRPGATGLTFAVEQATPSFCSSATYLVFLKATEATLQPQGELAETLAVTPDQKDGHGIFGRWNANGPGCAKLVSDLNCGTNFTAWEKAQPGDFLKIWWTDQIGGKERGHHVVYLGHDEQNLRFWSSNMPNGYGEKTVPRSSCARILFTRIDRPQNIARAPRLPAQDPFLEKMLRLDFTWAQVKQACRIR